MYSDTAIQALEKRIRWNEALDPAFTVQLSEENKEGTSGRHFQSFHQLVTIDNLYAAVPEISMAEEDFNKFLEDMRKQAVISVMGQVLDRNGEYLEASDYDAEIIAKKAVFDDSIGYTLARNVLEFFVSSGRKNFRERNARLAIADLKLEIEGFKNERGITVAVGLNQKIEKAIRTAARKFFPIVPIVQDASNMW